MLGRWKPKKKRILVKRGPRASPKMVISSRDTVETDMPSPGDEPPSATPVSQRMELTEETELAMPSARILLQVPSISREPSNTPKDVKVAINTFSHGKSSQMEKNMLYEMETQAIEVKDGSPPENSPQNSIDEASTLSDGLGFVEGRDEFLKIVTKHAVCFLFLVLVCAMRVNPALFVSSFFFFLFSIFFSYFNVAI